MKINLISRCVLAFTLIGATHVASANDAKPFVCGSAKITVSPARVRGGNQVLQDFLVNITQPNRAQTFKFSAENDFLLVRCEENQNDESLLLANHHCGGSGCAESNFSIIDPNSFKVLLSANARQKGNHSAAEGIIGKKIKPFTCGRFQEEYCYSVNFE